MVEVIVGFVILVMVLAECMVHLLGVSGELVKKSKDTCACHNITRCPDIFQLTDTDRRPEYKLFFLDFGSMIQPEILELR